jgi:hypothetical protein
MKLKTINAINEIFEYINKNKNLDPEKKKGFLEAMLEIDLFAGKYHVLEKTAGGSPFSFSIKNNTEINLNHFFLDSTSNFKVGYSTYSEFKTDILNSPPGIVSRPKEVSAEIHRYHFNDHYGDFFRILPARKNTPSKHFTREEALFFLASFIMYIDTTKNIFESQRKKYKSEKVTSVYYFNEGEVREVGAFFLKEFNTWMIDFTHPGMVMIKPDYPPKVI